MVNTESKQIILSILGIAILIVAVVGVSYAVVTTTVSSSKENGLSTGTISVKLQDGGSSVAINNAMPISDEQGMQLIGSDSVFDFSVETSIAGVSTINYEIYAEKLPIEQEMLSDANVRFYLERKSEQGYEPTPITFTPQPFIPLSETTFLGSAKGAMLLYSGTFTNTVEESNTYQENFRLRMWVSNDTILDSISRGFKVKLNVSAKAI